jgi:hypothetical protein
MRKNVTDAPPIGTVQRRDDRRSQFAVMIGELRMQFGQPLDRYWAARASIEDGDSPNNALHSPANRLGSSNVDVALLVGQIRDACA